MSMSYVWCVSGGAVSLESPAFGQCTTAPAGSLPLAADALPECVPDSKRPHTVQVAHALPLARSQNSVTIDMRNLPALSGATVQRPPAQIGGQNSNDTLYPNLDCICNKAALFPARVQRRCAPVRPVGLPAVTPLVD